MIEDCDHRELADTPDFRIEATLGGHFVILQGNDDEKLVKVANVKKDNYNINIMENFPMDIEIGPNMDLLFLCLVIGAVQEINAQQSGQSWLDSNLEADAEEVKEKQKEIEGICA